MSAKPENREYGYAVNLVHSICCLAGVPSYVDDLRADLLRNGVLVAVNDPDTARLFDWLMSILSFQGIADRVAEDFIYKHGNVGWSDIEQALAASPSCPKLGGYWLFNDCRYHKTSGTCAELDYIAACPLPCHPLRNGRLNQTAYSLYLFIRDVAGGDLINWIDQQLRAADTNNDPCLSERCPHRTAAKRLRGVGQGVGNGFSRAANGSWETQAAVVSSRRLVCCDRHPGSQLFASNRDPAEVRSRPRVWHRVLPATWLLRDPGLDSVSNRCHGLQPGVSDGLSSVCPKCHLALLR